MRRLPTSETAPGAKPRDKSRNRRAEHNLRGSRPLAYVAAAEGDYSSAAVMLREAVGVAREIGDVTMMMWGRCWTTLAATLAARGSTEHAVQVLAAAEFLREEAGVELAGYTLRLHERVKRQLWESIGEQVAAAVWDQGRSQASDEFLDQALRDLD